MRAGGQREYDCEIAEKNVPSCTASPDIIVHPGRGKTGGADLLAWETGYLRRLLDEVTKEKPTMPPPAGAHTSRAFSPFGSKSACLDALRKPSRNMRGCIDRA
ncbi:MAG TPA: hypothetical protein VM694_07115 [Polyangium sp.]|nr:hypothetical protein [Polyangium sp.]